MVAPFPRPGAGRCALRPEARREFEHVPCGQLIGRPMQNTRKILLDGLCFGDAQSLEVNYPREDVFMEKKTKLVEENKGKTSVELRSEDFGSRSKVVGGKDTTRRGWGRKADQEVAKTSQKMRASHLSPKGRAIPDPPSHPAPRGEDGTCSPSPQLQEATLFFHAHSFIEASDFRPSSCVSGTRQAPSPLCTWGPRVLFPSPAAGWESSGNVLSAFSCFLGGSSWPS